MEGLSLTRILIDGALLSAVLTAIVLGSLYYNPRLWLQDYPAEIQARVLPLSAQEKRQRGLVVILFLVGALGTLAYSVLQLRAANGGSMPFLTAYLHVFGVLSLFNLFDAVVLDLILLTGFKPKFAVIPGAEGMEHLYHNWGMHLSNFFKGMGFCLVFSLPVAVIAAL
ncbi:hypothetical protein BAC2_01258 [uncultured bacterium]|nr:hypothetical protein BAC2_01258 [uncultured bacterium]